MRVSISKEECKASTLPKMYNLVSVKAETRRPSIFSDGNIMKVNIVQCTDGYIQSKPSNVSTNIFLYSFAWAPAFCRVSPMTVHIMLTQEAQPSLPRRPRRTAATPAWRTSSR